jgi:hypothetical protein
MFMIDIWLHFGCINGCMKINYNIIYQYITMLFWLHKRLHEKCIREPFP